MRDRLGAFCDFTDVRIVGSKTGELAGLELAAKDVFDIRGYRTSAGNPDWLTSHPPALETASAVQRLMEAGATLIGKTHTDELTYSLNGENFHYGTPENVNAPGRIPGGSSSGSAAAVAGGLADIALGTDTGGSVRLPASNCGICGFRPTHGRVSKDHVVPLAPGFDTVGWFTRSPDLLQRIGPVLIPDHRSIPAPSRLLLATDAFQLADQAVRPDLVSAVATIRNAFDTYQEIGLFSGSASDWMHSFRILQGAEVWRTHGAWIRETQPVFGPEISERFEWAATIDQSSIELARKTRSLVCQRLDQILSPDAVLCIPTSPSIALPKNSAGEELENFRSRALSLLCVAGLAGLPQVSLPLARHQGCPIGISLIGTRHSDEALLSIASSIPLTPA